MQKRCVAVNTDIEGTHAKIFLSTPLWNINAKSVGIQPNGCCAATLSKAKRDGRRGALCQHSRGEAREDDTRRCWLLISASAWFGATAVRADSCFGTQTINYFVLARA
jgi:hypothetical protein